MSLRRLLIIGASDFGRDLETYLDLKPLKNREWKIAGFLDDDLNALDGFRTDYRILSNIGSFTFRKGDLALLAISDPINKQKICKRLKDKVTFLTYVAPDAFIGKFVKIGEGSVICPQAFVGPGVVIGRAVTINGGTKLGHDVRIGDYSSLMVDITIGGHSKLGKSVFVGSGATIIPKRTICDLARVGAGSVVIRNISEQMTVFGNPAVPI